MTSPISEDKVSERPADVPEDVWEAAGMAIVSPAFSRHLMRVRVARAIVADRARRTPAPAPNAGGDEWSTAFDAMEREFVNGLLNDIMRVEELLRGTTAGANPDAMRKHLAKCKELAAAVRALAPREAERPEAAEGWRTMDSAPHDGKAVSLLLSSGREIDQGWWGPSAICDTEDYDGIEGWHDHLGWIVGEDEQAIRWRLWRSPLASSKGER